MLRGFRRLISRNRSRRSTHSSEPTDSGDAEKASLTFMESCYEDTIECARPARGLLSFHGNRSLAARQSSPGAADGSSPILPLTSEADLRYPAKAQEKTTEEPYPCPRSLESSSQSSTTFRDETSASPNLVMPSQDIQANAHSNNMASITPKKQHEQIKSIESVIDGLDWLRDGSFEHLHMLSFIQPHLAPNGGYQRLSTGVDHQTKTSSAEREDEDFLLDSPQSTSSAVSWATAEESPWIPKDVSGIMHPASVQTLDEQSHIEAAEMPTEADTSCSPPLAISIKARRCSMEECGTELQSRALDDMNASSAVSDVASQLEATSIRNEMPVGESMEIGRDASLVPAPATVPNNEDIVRRSQYNSMGTTLQRFVAPAVVHETAVNQIHHIREESILREIHNYSYLHRILPLRQKEVLPAKHYRVENGRLVGLNPAQIPQEHQSKRIVLNTVTHDIIPVHLSHKPTKGHDPRKIEERTCVMPDGHLRTEHTWVHAPSYETGGCESGQTVALVF